MNLDMLDITSSSVLNYSLSFDLSPLTIPNSPEDIKRCNNLAEINEYLEKCISHFQTSNNLLKNISETLTVQIVNISNRIQDYVSNEEENVEDIKNCCFNLSRLFCNYSFIINEGIEYLQNNNYGFEEMKENYKDNLNIHNNNVIIKKGDTDNINNVLDTLQGIMQSWERLNYFPETIVSQLKLHEMRIKHCIEINKNNKFFFELFRNIFITVIMEIRKVFVKFIIIIIENNGEKYMEDDILINMIDLFIDCTIECKTGEIMIGIRSIIKIWINNKQNHLKFLHWCNRKQMKWDIEISKKRKNLKKQRQERMNNNYNYYYRNDSDSDSELDGGSMYWDKYDLGKLFIREVIAIVKESDGDSIDEKDMVMTRFSYKEFQESKIIKFIDDEKDMIKILEENVKNKPNFIKKEQEENYHHHNNNNDYDNIQIDFNDIKKKKDMNKKKGKPPSIIYFWYYQQLHKIEHKINNINKKYDSIFLKKPEKHIITWIEYSELSSDEYINNERIIVKMSKRSRKYWKKLCRDKIVEPTAKRLLTWLQT